MSRVTVYYFTECRPVLGKTTVAAMKRRGWKIKRWRAARRKAAQGFELGKRVAVELLATMPKKEAKGDIFREIFGG